MAAGCRATVGQMRNSQTGSSDQCPACGESDLRPYGNGSKWACPQCYLILPCCEGGELVGLPAVGRRNGGLPDRARQPPWM